MSLSEAPSLLRGVDRAVFASALVGALRRAGVSAGLQATERFAAALDTIAPRTRTELYWLSRVSLVSDLGDFDTFDRVFDVVFEGGALPTGRDARKAQPQPPPSPDDAHQRLHQRPDAPEAPGGVPWMSSPSISDGDNDPAGESDLELPELLPADLAEIAEEPFDRLNNQDLERIGAWIENAIVSWPTRTVRRTQVSRRGRTVDARQTLRRAQRTGGDPIDLAFKRRRQRPRRVVMLADVSGSMQSFVRPYLHVMRALATLADAEIYAFATELTRITTALRSTEPSAAIERASELVDDRFSGTRIANSIFSLTSHPTWSTSVRGAVVLVASDGWDTDPPEVLDQRMARLARMAHRVVWVNPRAAAPDYEPLVAGMAAALPHCSVMLSGHNLHALRAVLNALAD